MTTYGPPITPGRLAVSIVLGEVGVKEDPPGSNRGQHVPGRGQGCVDDYIRAAGLDPEQGSYAWCAGLVCWSFKMVTPRLGPLRFRRHALVRKLLELNQDLVVTEPEPGDIFIHLNPDGTGHCGLVTGVYAGGIATLEGNTDKAGSRTGGQVMHQNRPASYVNAYLRVTLAGAVPGAEMDGDTTARLTP
jgi:hypothetical protein